MDRRVERGEVRLTYDEGSGYLRSVLDALRLPGGRAAETGRWSDAAEHVTPWTSATEQ